ncbi:hypothetical protein Tsubulata_008420 [Turnera subulata]|uniref:BHLH domain-containing protein n=1 Tax=Turnera subulata TaxID=218843 RepID=A0A9Q0GC42_9ROSI|nr:hypothetical protein Tsubulata_008420 [Turnera subulata]
MLPNFQSYLALQASYSLKQNHNNGFLQEPNLVNVMDGAAGESILSSSSSRAETSRKSTEACKSHKEAERRRRQRINSHLSTLRTLLPSATKTDKASLLAEVVQHVRELKQKAADVARPDGEGMWGQFPGETDEATLRCCDGAPEAKKTITVSVCCDDRPGLNRDLSQAIRSVRGGRAVRAEMMTVGGRTKNVVVMQWGGEEEELGGLRKALKGVVENRDSGSGLDRVANGNKRARVLGSGGNGGGADVFMNGSCQIDTLDDDTLGGL